MSRIVKPEKPEQHPAIRIGGLLVLIGLGWIVTNYFRGMLELGDVDSAIVSLRAMVGAEGAFATAHPALGYTCAISELPPDKMMGAVVKNKKRNGYAFEISACQAEHLNGPNARFRVTARPLKAHMPAFCSDQSGVVRSDESGSPEKCLLSGVPL